MEEKRRIIGNNVVDGEEIKNEGWNEEKRRNLCNYSRYGERKE